MLELAGDCEEGELHLELEMFKTSSKRCLSMLIRWSRAGRLPSEPRRVVIHLLERWRRITIHHQRPGIPNSVNWVEEPALNSIQ